MFIIKHRNIFFAISGFCIIVSLWLLIQYGLKLGTDFTGGTIWEVEYKNSRPALVEVKAGLAKLAELGPVSIQQAGQDSLLLRLRDISQEEKEKVVKVLDGGGQHTFAEKRFSSIGPIVGKELSRRGLIAIALVCLLIILFITFAFRKVSRPISSWKYGLIAVLALLHDLVIPTGVFAWLGFSRGVEVDVLFLTGLLTILGISVHDTIVVFDRIRENLRLKAPGSFAEVVGNSLTQTFTRSVNTSLTIVFVLLVMYFIGAESTRWFSLLMAIGVFVGTYSSIFIASPLLVVWERFGQRKS